MDRLGFAATRGRKMNQVVPISSAALPALVAAAGEHASMRFLEFFAANIRRCRQNKLRRS